MSITITVSERTEKKIRLRAEKTGQNVDKVVSDLIEEVWDDHFRENAGGLGSKDPQNPFDQFLGMFASGKTDTSSSYKQTLLDDVKMPGGFGGK